MSVWTTDAREKVLEEVRAERLEQVALGWTAAHDDGHAPSGWVALLARHLGLAVDDGTPDASTRFRRQMVRVAALAVAAVEAQDRKHPPEKVAGVPSHVKMGP